MFWSKGLPSGIEKDTSLVILIINVIAPGIGTVISAFLSDNFERETVIVGVLQLITTIFIVGYFWAIAWSVLLFRKASGQEGVPLFPRYRESTYEPLVSNPPTPAETQV